MVCVKMILSSAEGWPLRSLPTSFLACKVGEGCWDGAWGITPPSGTSSVCGCWKAEMCMFPYHDFQIFSSLYRASPTALRTTRVLKTAFAVPPNFLGCGGECENS